MKIAFFQPHIGPGGLTHVMLTLASGLSNRGYQVDLVVLGRSLNFELIEKIPGNVNLIKLPAKRSVLSLLVMAKYLKDNKPDILISGGPPANCIALLSKIIARSRTKQIITEHSLPTVDVYDTKKRIDQFIPFLMKMLYPKANHIVAVSNSVADDLSKFLKINGDRIKTIYNPVITNSLPEMASQLVCHPWLENKENFVFLFVGRLEFVKHVDILLSAFSYLVDEQYIKLLIVGDGSEKSKLKNISEKLDIQDRVDFLGYASNPYSYMKQADCLVLCSL